MARKKKHTVHYTERPQVKQRPRMTRRGRAYTPQQTHLAEDAIRNGWTGPCFSGPVYLEVDFHKDGSIVTVGILDEEAYPSTPLRGDIDNYVKLVMDGLNRAAYDDDSQIRLIVARKL
jgi:Holliday junction resolvase RusA-like endonuclease